jgi:hypothetical protein
MATRKSSFGNKLAKKSTREAKRIAKGVFREGRKIALGATKGFLSALNPFR